MPLPPPAPGLLVPAACEVNPEGADAIRHVHAWAAGPAGRHSPVYLDAPSIPQSAREVRRRAAAARLRGLLHARCRRPGPGDAVGARRLRRLRRDDARERGAGGGGAVADGGEEPALHARTDVFLGRRGLLGPLQPRRDAARLARARGLCRRQAGDAPAFQDRPVPTPAPPRLLG